MSSNFSTSQRKKLPDFTKVSIPKALLTLSIPIVFANILQTAYQLVDTFWVGRIGAIAVAAVSLSFPILFFLISIGGGLAIAGTILVAQYKGKGDIEKVDFISAQTLMVMTIVSVIVSILGYFFSPFILELMGADADVLPAATSYLQISFLGIIAMFSYFIFQSLMRGVGDVKTPVYVALLTVILNVILDPLFILGYGPVPAYGVTGAALATIGTQGIAAVIGIGMLFSGRYGIHLKWKNFRPHLETIKKMLAVGIPASINQSSRALGLMVMTFLIASFGTTTIAAYGIGTRIMSFVIIPAVGLSVATSTLIGQHIGARKIDRAERIANISARISFLILTSVGLLAFLFAPVLANAFLPGEIAAASSATLFIRILAFSFGFIGLQQTYNGAFNGSGSTKTTMMITIVSLWVFQFPLAYILSKHTSLAEVGIWIAFPTANIASATLAYILFKQGGWKKKNLTNEEELDREMFEEIKTDEGVQ